VAVDALLRLFSSITVRTMKFIRYGWEEIKFIKSFQDIEIFFNQKLPFLIHRIIGPYFSGSRVPPTLQLEPTNHCNINCLCCPNDKMSRKKGYLDYGLFQKIIDDASRIGVKPVHLYLNGEPLLHPQIVQMIGYIKSKGLGFNLITNGMLLTRDKIKAILRSGVNSADYLTFSLLGHSREVHEQVMKGVRHDTVINNIHEFLSLRDELNVNGPIIQVVLYQLPENRDEISDFVSEWRGKVDHVITVGGVVEKVAKLGFEDVNPLPMRTQTCKLLCERMTIYWNGDVALCAVDWNGENVFGSLKDNTIREIWNCTDLVSVKGKHKEKRFSDLKFCAMCDQ